MQLKLHLGTSDTPYMYFNNGCTLILLQTILRCVKDFTISEFLFAHLGTDSGAAGTDLPQRSELPLFDAQELRAFVGDNSGMSRGVVQDRLSKGCPSPQCAYNNSILKPNKMGWWHHF